MGSSSLMDIIGSFIVSGILLLMGFQLNAAANEVRVVYSQNYIMQTNLTAVVDLLDSDFRKIGYCRDWRAVANPTQSLRIADSSRIRFRTDYNNDGKLDSITYYLGPASDFSSSPNPNIRYLMRQLNNDSVHATRLNFGLTNFKFTYWDAADSLLKFPITDPRLAYYMTLNLAVASPAPYGQVFGTDSSKYQVYWKQMRLVTKNLANR